MTQDEIVQLVEASTEDQWESLSGPLYENTEPEEHRGHHSQAVYIPNVAIGLRWGHEVVRPFTEDWHQHFPDKRAWSALADITYNGVPVYRTLYVVVDGGRARLPLPRQTDGGTLSVSAREAALMRLIDRLSIASEFDRYMEMANFTVDRP